MPKITPWSIIKSQHYFYNLQSLFSALLLTFCVGFRTIRPPPQAPPITSMAASSLTVPKQRMANWLISFTFLGSSYFSCFFKNQIHPQWWDSLSLRIYWAPKSSGNDGIFGVSGQLPGRAVRKETVLGWPVPVELHLITMLFSLGDIFFFLGQYKTLSQDHMYFKLINLGWVRFPEIGSHLQRLSIFAVFVL